MENLLPEGDHAFHIHTNGDCEDFGPLFDPFGKPKGLPEVDGKNRKVGNIGNIRSSWRGLADYYRWDDLIKLNGPNSVLGRTVIVYELPEKRGKDGEFLSPGPPIACGIIVPGCGEEEEEEVEEEQPHYEAIW